MLPDTLVNGIEAHLSTRILFSLKTFHSIMYNLITDLPGFIAARLGAPKEFSCRITFRMLIFDVFH